jgi:hypothetical protein
LQRDQNSDADFSSQRADNMNLLFAVKGDFLKRAFEKPKRCTVLFLAEVFKGIFSSRLAWKQ